MCKCTPAIRTPFCGRPGCEWPEPVQSSEPRWRLRCWFVIDRRRTIPGEYRKEDRRNLTAAEARELTDQVLVDDAMAPVEIHLKREGDW